MAIKTPNRYQMTTLPAAIEDYVSADDPVRAYDAMIDAMDPEELELSRDSKKVGAPPYDPVSMLKLLVYGYSYGWRSSRKLERAVYHNLSFIWLMGGLRPDHKTISNFRRNNKKLLKSVLKRTVRLCIKLDLIEGNRLFADGSKIRGNASISQTKSLEKWEKTLAEVDDRIDRLIEESERIDEEESGSLIKLDKELNSANKLREKVKSVIEEGKSKELEKINGTDADARNFRGRQGSHAGYNAQIVTDEKNGLIASAEVVGENNDNNQLARQIDQANDNLEKTCAAAVADAGYFVVEDIKKLTDQGIDVIVPSQRQVSKAGDSPFHKDKFYYDSAKNEYICPEGNRLYYSYYSTKKDHFVYRMIREADCRECRHYGVCTKAKRGRNIYRLRNEDLKIKLERRYASDEGKAIFKKRKEKVESPFGHIKRNLNASAFLVRGLESVKAEFAIYASCFNIVRMITLLGGVPKMIRALKAIG